MIDLTMKAWYWQRLRTMSLRELLYRTEQRFQAGVLKKYMGIQQAPMPYSTHPGILPIPHELTGIDEDFDVLGIPLSPADIGDWGLDVLTGRRFPAIYAKEINIRTGEHGSAKHVWEINRMLFLPRLALLYRTTAKEQYLSAIIRLVTSWVAQNPYLKGVNWYSNIEVNIRLINWFLTWEILQVEALREHQPLLARFADETWVPAIYQHCQFSYVHPSLHSSANNHLIAEYAGLFIASAKWHFPESGQWNRYAGKGLEKEIIRQHSVNGINREEAAEYIQFVTDFFLLSMLVGDRTDRSFSPRFKEAFKNILYYIREMLTIDGQYPRYGDEDDGRVFALNPILHDNNFTSLLQSGAIYFRDGGLWPPTQDLDLKNRLFWGEEAVTVRAAMEPAAQLRPSKFYPREGHFIFRKQAGGGREIYCHFNAAPLGYLSIAAHGHADALSFILQVDGQPVLVDPGTYCYHTHAEWRRYFVSTRAHNTICIDGANQASFIGPTLWLNHYRTSIQDYGLSDGYEYVVARHNGYRKKKVAHTRKLEFYKSEDRILITDHITNNTGRKVVLEMPFHLHPTATYTMDGCQARIRANTRNVILQLDHQLEWKLAEGQLSPMLGWYSAGFYQKTPAPVIIGTLPMKGALVLRTELLIA